VAMLKAHDVKEKSDTSCGAAVDIRVAIHLPGNCNV